MSLIDGFDEFYLFTFNINVRGLNIYMHTIVYATAYPGLQNLNNCLISKLLTAE